MVDILVRDYEDLALEERVRAVKAAEQVAKVLVSRDIARIKEEEEEAEHPVYEVAAALVPSHEDVNIGTVYLKPRQCVELLAQELGADAPEIQALLRRSDEDIRLDPRVITMQEVWADEKVSYLYRSYLWYREDESNVPLSKEQLRVARSLAHLYGHNWAWALAGRPPHEYGRGMHVKRPRLLTPADIYRYTVDLLEEDDYGTDAPDVVDGNIVHVTGTGRLTWLIRPDGSVQLTVCRPAGWVLRAELGAERPRKVVVVRNPAIPLHRRHVEALERPIRRLAPRWAPSAAAVGPIADGGHLCPA